MNRNQTALVAAGGAVLLLVVSVWDQSPDRLRFEFDFASPSNSGEEIEMIRAEVRPPHLDWFIPVNIFECRTVGDCDRQLCEGIPADNDPAEWGRFKCQFDIPERWGCGELFLRRFALTPAEDPRAPGAKSTSQISEPSNVITYGVCPNPMPERVKLATPEEVALPEPDFARNLILVILCLGGIFSATTRKGNRCYSLKSKSPRSRS